MEVEWPRGLVDTSEDGSAGSTEDDGSEAAAPAAPAAQGGKTSLSPRKKRACMQCGVVLVRMIQCPCPCPSLTSLA